MLSQLTGKTTLLKALAGKGKCTGQITLGLEQFDPTLLANQKRVAFVADIDAFEESATCYESIYFSARLRLPSAVSNDDINDVVNRLMKDLRLEKCATTQCKNMSCGERRRLSLGVELVASPRIALLDEPTSGLDR